MVTRLLDNYDKSAMAESNALRKVGSSWAANHKRTRQALNYNQCVLDKLFVVKRILNKN